MTDKQRDELEALRKRLGAKVDPKLAERNWTRAFLANSGLPSDLTAKMADVAERESERCGVCGVGRGRWCEHR